MSTEQENLVVAVENELEFLNWKFILEGPTVNRTQKLFATSQVG